jgi:hypothetical protein
MNNAKNLEARPHLYISTYCEHGYHEGSHPGEPGECRKICKFCPAVCLCPCHRPPAETPDLHNSAETTRST